MKIFSFFAKTIKNTLLSFQHFCADFKMIYENSPKAKKFFEKLQITIIYFFYYFNFVDLFLLKSKEYTYPNIFLEFLKAHLTILNIPLIHFLFNTDNTFFLHLIITQIVIQRKEIIFNTFVKFHIFLLISMDCFQRLLLEYLIFFTSKEALGTTAPKFSSVFYITLFSISFISYFYSYLCGLLEKDPKFPAPFDIITRSAFFWVRSKKKAGQKFSKQ